MNATAYAKKKLACLLVSALLFGLGLPVPGMPAGTARADGPIAGDTGSAPTDAASLEPDAVSVSSPPAAALTVSPETGSGGAPFAAAPNPVVNGGFEATDALGMPSGWAFARFSGSYSATVDEAVYAEGQRSLRIQAAQTARAAAYQDVPVTGGQSVTLSQSVKLENVVSSLRGATLRVQYYDAAEVSLGSVFYGEWKGTQNWFRLGFLLEPPAATVKARLEYFLWEASGTVWFDAIQLDDTPPSGGLLRNGGFEYNDGGGKPADWSIAKFSGTYDASVNASVYLEGRQSLRIHADEPARVSAYQDIAVASGQYVKLSQWVKTEAVEGELGALIRLQYYDSANANLGTVYFDQWRGTNDWFLSSFFIRPPAGTVKARLEFFLWNSSGTLWLDDVSAVISKYPPPALTKAVYRPDGQAQLFWKPAAGTDESVTVSVYAHSSPLDDSTLPSAVLVQSGIPVAEGRAAFAIDPAAYPFVGIVASHPADGDSAVAGKRLEAYQVPVPSTFESVRGFDGSIVSAWTLTEEDAALLTGATVSLYTSDAPVTDQNLAQARLLSSGIPAARASAEAVPAGSQAADSHIGIIVTDSQGEASPVIPAEIRTVSQILPEVDEGAPAARSHPFLFYTSETLDRAKKKIETYSWAKNAFQQMKKRVDPLVAAPEIVYPAFGTGLRDASDPIIQFMTNTRDAGLLYQLTGETQYAEYVKKVLLGLASSYLDLPYADATRARWDFELLAEIRHMMHLMSAYDLIMPSGILDEEQRGLIETRLFRTNYENSRRYIEINPNMRYSNWVTWMDFSVGATGVLLNRPDWVDFAVNHPVTGIKNNLLNNVNEDGFFLENSVAYQKFTAAASIGFAEALYNSNMDLYHAPLSGIRERDGLVIQNKYPIRELLASLDYYRFTNNAVPPVGDSGILSYSPLISIMLNESELAYLRYGRDPDLGKAMAYAVGSDRSAMPRDAGFIYAEPLDGIDQEPFTIGTNVFANAGYNWLGSSVFEDTGAVFFRSPGGRSASNLDIYWDPYGSATGHYHSDKLSMNIHMLGQKAIQEAGSYSYDETGPQIPWGRTTLAHNTIVVDETSQAPQALSPWAMWAGDTAERTSAGEKKALGIGPLFKVIRAYNDKAYGGVLPIFGSTFGRTKLEDRLFDTALDRTVAMIGDYVIDLFQASSPGQHQYDYPLHFPFPQQAGEYAGDAPLQPVSGPLGAKNGYDKVDSVSRTATDEDWTYTLALNDGQIGIRMIGEPGTEIIKGSTIGDHSILIARRSGRQETHYASLFEPYREASAVAQFAYAPVDGPAKGLLVERLDGGKDYLLVGQGEGLKSVSETALSTDGNVAFKRLDPAGAAAAIAFTEGTNASAGSVALQTDRHAGSLQWTKLGSDMVRIDFRGEPGTAITVSDVQPGTKAYALDDQGQAVKELAVVRSGDRATFAAESARQAFCLCASSAVGQLPEADRVTVENTDAYSALPAAALAEPESDFASAASVTVEAEQLISESAGSVSLTIKPDAQPPGEINSFKGWDYIGHTIRWNAHIDEPGYYLVQFRYAAALDQSFRTFQIDDTGAYNVYFPNTGGWNSWDTQSLHRTNGSYLLFSLAEGDHTIAMTNSSTIDGVGTNLDYLRLVRIDEPPSWTEAGTLTAEQTSETELLLRWAPAGGKVPVTGYKVYLNGQDITEPDRFAAANGKLTYRVGGLSPLASYSFKVEAGNETGRWSADGPSVIVTARDMDTSPPAVVFEPDGSEIPLETASVIVTVSDDWSGVDEASLQFAWSPDETAPSAGWTPFASGDAIVKSGVSGSLYLHIQAADLAGNLAAAHSKRFRFQQQTEEKPQAASIALTVPTALRTNQTIAVTGTVRDAGQSPLSGAAVSLTAASGAIDPLAVTDGKGAFTAEFRAPGYETDAVITAFIPGTAATATAVIRVIAAEGGGGTGTEGNGGPSAGSEGETAGPAPETPPGAIVGVKPGELKAERGIVRLVLEDGQEGVSLPGNAAVLIGEGAELLVSAGAFKLSIPAGALASIARSLPEPERQESAIVIRIKQAGSPPHPRGTAGGPAYEWSIDLVGKDGMAQRPSPLDTPVAATIAASDVTNPRLAGIYEIHEDGTFRLIGGAYGQDGFTAELNRPGKYGVYQYTRAYSDVPAGHWAYAVIQELSFREIADGVTGDAFAPDRTLTRAEWTSLLIRALGAKPGEGAAKAEFRDVRDEDWFADAVRTAFAIGLAQGAGEGAFEPNRTVTRQEMTVMLVRAIEWQTGRTLPEGEAGFADREQISDWAASAVGKAAALRLIEGRGAGRFDPTGAATRAESAKLIYMLIGINKDSD